MNWTDVLTLEGADPKRGQLQLAMYALHLASGCSINAHKLKLATIKVYIRAVAIFLGMFCGRDLRFDNPGDTSFGHLLQPVFKDLEKYETVPNRREPYTIAMQLRVEAMSTSLAMVQPFCLCVMLVKWFGLNLMAGCRIAEWAQPSSRDPHRPQQNCLLPPSITTAAFVQSDIRMSKWENGVKCAVGLDILKSERRAYRKEWLRWRTQKNKDNGQERLFTQNPNVDGHCAIHYTYHILEGFAFCLKKDPSLDPVSTPLSVYYDYDTDTVKSITSADVETFMRAIASSVYFLHPQKHKEALSKWGTHSLRVGPCVLLHAMGFNHLDIQWLLRWRSLAFMAYLRNNCLLTDQHHAALDSARSIPHLF